MQHIGIYGAEQLPVSEATGATSCTKAVRVPSYNRLLLGVSEEYGDSGTPQKKDVKKTPVKCYYQL